MNREASRHYHPAGAVHPDPKLGSLQVDTAALIRDFVLPTIANFTRLAANNIKERAA